MSAIPNPSTNPAFIDPIADPVALTQQLVRFDTSNPPGNEAEAIQHIKALLDAAGIQSQTFAKSPNRPNLIARLPGDGSAPPLLLQGHVDVVPADPSQWQQPPFSGNIVDGYLWGRGTLDMKGGIATMVSALIQAKSNGLTPAGDIVLALVCDEEAGGHHGARYLVEEHAEEFEGVQYAIGEFGGFSFNIGSRRFYPIMVAEKQVCHIRVTFRGPGGHASLGQQDNPVHAMTRFLQGIQSRQLPTHVTPETMIMLRAIGRNLPPLSRMVMKALLTPGLTAPTLKLLGSKGRTFSPLFRNTANPTVIRGGGQINVVPSEVSVDLDGRILPTLAPEVLISELTAAAGADSGAEFEVLSHDPGPEQPDMGLFETLAGVLKESDPDGIPVPMLMPAATDGRLFARLGIQTYGFLPMRLPADLDFASTIHGPNERVTVEAIRFGADAFYRLLQSYGRTP